MDQQTLQKGFGQLDALALEEYHQSLQEVAGDGNQERVAIRIGRLVGVILKERFAKPATLDEPSERTKAYRAWQLMSAEEFDKLEKNAIWQYQTLEEIHHALSAESPHLEDWSVYKLAQDAQNETGFFGYFARTLRLYICRDPEIRQKVEDVINEATKGNKNIPTVTPETLMGAGGLALGAYLVQAIPIFGFVGAPVIAAVVVILYTLGTEAFCEWSAELRTDEDEK